MARHRDYALSMKTARLDNSTSVPLSFFKIQLHVRCTFLNTLHRSSFAILGFQFSVFNSPSGKFGFIGSLIRATLSHWFVYFQSGDTSAFLFLSMTFQYFKFPSYTWFVHAPMCLHICKFITQIFFSQLTGPELSLRIIHSLTRILITHSCYRKSSQFCIHIGLVNIRTSMSENILEVTGSKQRASDEILLFSTNSNKVLIAYNFVETAFIEKSCLKR